jgi:outer membrane immunogenic protein
MRKFLVAIGIAAAGFCAAPANAQTPWTGYYAGVQGGYAFKGMVGLDLDNNSNTDQRGFFGGGQIGGNWQNGNSVFGVNVNYNASHIQGSKDLGGELYSGTVRSFGTAEARIGGLINPTNLLFASGGVAFGRAYGQLDVGGARFSDTRWMTGFTVGAGWEWLINTNTSLFIQYKFVDLGSSTFTLDDPERVHFRYNAAMIGANWKH